MEGPSLLLAAQLLKPFIKKTIWEVNGNTRIGKQRLLNRQILDIFSWGKHLVFQFDDFALRVHFMLFGSFEAFVKNKKVNGDYPIKNRPPRLQLICDNGEIILFSCSLKFIESKKAKKEYDFSIDIMSSKWDSQKALNRLQEEPDKEIADLLLDQSVFAGVGNIIKNEVLFLEKTQATRKISELSLPKLKEIIKTAQSYSKQFYKWRKKFELRKHYQVYRQSVCPICKGKVFRKKTGVRQRFSFTCPNCQK